MGLMTGGFVKFVLFPEFDQQDVGSNVEFPRGTPPDVTAAAVRQIEQAFLRVTEDLKTAGGESIVRNYSSAVGQTGGSQFDQTSGNHVGNVRVELVASQHRDIGAQELLHRWEAETGVIPGVLSLTFATREEGPPGAPIQVSLSGQRIETLLAVSKEIQAKLRTYDGVYQIEDSFRPGKNELQLDLKPEARTLGIQLDDLARQVYAGYFGEEAVRLQRGRDDIRVRVRYTEDQRSTLAKLADMRIRTPQGDEVPFFSVADVRFAQGDAAISRVDGLRSVIVMAEIDPNRANADEVLADLEATTLPELQARYPGWSYDFWGAQQQSREAFEGLVISFPIAMLAMFVVIAAVFRSYVQPLLIMVTVPFGIIGAVWGHFVMGIDLAMFSVFGMVALTGVVVNDAIVLIEAVNTNIARGMPVMEAIRKGGGRRFRAIMLTTISTVGGLLPLILERQSGAEVVIPMALSIASGVAFATLLTLFYVPCLLGILNDVRRLAHRVLRGEWPTREEVEPARLRFVDPLADHPEETIPGAGDPIAAK
jgi:multidrug efflux pump subunit AcrB